jgi:hypothetical protein
VKLANRSSMEIQMSSRSWFPRRLLVVPFLCLPLTLLISADCQAPGAAGQGQTAQMPDLRILNYDAFLRFLGNQEDHKQTAMQTGSTPAVARPDYSSAIGIGKDEEQTMLTTLLDTYREEKEIAQKWGATAQECRLDNIAQISGSTDIDNEIACRKELQTNLQETRSKLKSELGEASFNRLDRYIKTRGWEAEPTSDSNPCPGRFVSSPQETTRHQACATVYENFVRHIAWTKAENQKVAAGAEGVFDKKVGFYVPIQISEEERKALVSLSLETDRLIKEADSEFVSKAHEFIRQNGVKYGASAYKLPLPPEIEALSRKSGDLLEAYISQLREELGEELFRQFDAYLSHWNPSTKRVSAESPAIAPSLNQAPAVRP